MKRILTLSDFDYELPDRLVAQNPTLERTQARLMHRDCFGNLSEASIAELPMVIPEGSLIIANNSRVIQARIKFMLPSGGQAELFLLEPVPSQPGESLWRAIGKPTKKLRKGLSALIGGLEVSVAQDPNRSDALLCRFPIDPRKFPAWLECVGAMPLPPYIKRRAGDVHETQDKERYQTIYSKTLGSVAAPTAGLHVTSSLIERLRDHGCAWHEVTLHVGGGTFMPVKHEDLDQHMMHEEAFTVPKPTLQAILDAKSTGRPVVAIGTTTLRTLESFFKAAGGDETSMEGLADRWLRTNLFLRPATADERYRPWAVDLLMTNFHQPKSTLFMLVCHLIGFVAAHEAYGWAIEKNLRFFSYGDSCLFDLRLPH